MNSIHTFLLTVILIIGIPRICDAQIEPYSKVLWDTEEFGMQAYAFCQTLDKKTIIIGETFQFKGFVMKIDHYGNPIWTKSLAIENSYLAPRLLGITNTFDSCQLILGEIINQNNNNHDAFIAKIDKNGEFLWTKTNSLGGLRNISQTADSGFILTGNHDFSSSAYKQLSIVKITKNGSLEWSRIIRFGTASSKGHSVSQLENGNYIVSGYYKNENENRTTGLLAEISSTGNVIWSRGYKNTSSGNGYSFDDFIIKGDYIYTIVGGQNNSLLVKTDTIGDIIFCKEIQSSTYWNNDLYGSRKLHINDNDELIFIWGPDFGGYTKVDLNGEVLSYSDLIFNAVDIAYTEDNGLLAVGNGPLIGVKNPEYVEYNFGLIQMSPDGTGVECVGNSNSYSTDFELEYLETEFIIEGGGITTNIPIVMGDLEVSQREGCVDFTGSISKVKKNLVSTYPNPNQGWINLKMEEPIHGLLSIINPLGQIIHQEKINQQQLKIDLNRFENGVYLYRIESDKVLISSGRFILNN